MLDLGKLLAGQVSYSDPKTTSLWDPKKVRSFSIVNVIMGIVLEVNI